MLYVIVGLLLFLADQALKFWTVSHVALNANPGLQLLPVLNLTYIKNTGLAFGLFGSLPALRWITLALLAAFVVFIALGIAKGFLRTGLARWSGALLLTGLLGNGIDRTIYGYVVDMLEPKLGSLTLPIFNIADCLIFIFGILFCISLLAGGIGAPARKRRRVEEDDEEAERRRRAARARRQAEEAERLEHAERQERTERRAARTEDADVKEAPARKQPERRSAESDSAETAVRTVERPAPKPAAKSESVARPAARTPAPVQAPVPAPAEDEFDLDSILAEFK